MNAFTWLMVLGDYQFTRFILIDHVLIEVEKRGTKPWYQTRYGYSHDPDLARVRALEATERLERLGYILIGRVKAAEILVVHEALLAECNRDHTVGPLLNSIINSIETHGVAA